MKDNNLEGYYDPIMTVIWLNIFILGGFSTNLNIEVSPFFHEEFYQTMVLVQGGQVEAGETWNKRSLLEQASSIKLTVQ